MVAGTGPPWVEDRLADMKVIGETDVGWCAATPPNETTDEDGRPLVRTAGFTAADPRAPGDAASTTIPRSWRCASTCAATTA